MNSTYTVLSDGRKRTVHQIVEESGRSLASVHSDIRLLHSKGLLFKEKQLRKGLGRPALLYYCKKNRPKLRTISDNVTAEFTPDYSRITDWVNSIDPSRIVDVDLRDGTLLEFFSALVKPTSVIHRIDDDITSIFAYVIQSKIHSTVDYNPEIARNKLFDVYNYLLGLAAFLNQVYEADYVWDRNDGLDQFEFGPNDQKLFNSLKKFYEKYREEN